MNTKLTGIVAAVLCGVLAIFLPRLWPFFAQVSPLILAIVIGVIISHTMPTSFRSTLEPGLNVAKGPVLRLAIVLYGFNISFQDLSSVGFHGFFIAVVMVSAILAVGIWVGRKIFKLDTDQAILISIGSAICGAAAVAAAEPILKAKPHKVIIAVATVVIFGTLSMFLFPVLYGLLSVGEAKYGLWVGVSIHEVAQVVAAGDAVSSAAANTAVIEKMIRVLLLVPVLIGLSVWKSRTEVTESGQRNPIAIPWFALFFLVVIFINSTGLIPAAVVSVLSTTATYLLAIAMASLGMMTHISVVKKAGARSFVLATLLFVVLITLGFLMT